MLSYPSWIARKNQCSPNRTKLCLWVHFDLLVKEQKLFFQKNTPVFSHLSLNILILTIWRNLPKQIESEQITGQHKNAIKFFVVHRTSPNSLCSLVILILMWIKKISSKNHPHFPPFGLKVYASDQILAVS